MSVGARIAELRALRAEDPGAIERALTTRRRRGLVEGDGRLFIVAADHPARGALQVGSNPLAMADRDELLARLVLALSRPDVDGVLATADILDDLALLGVLEGKVAVGSINRGGLRGAVFELDDRATGYDVPGMLAAGLDMGKALLRIDLDDPGTVRTLELLGRTVTEAAAAKLPILIEPFMSHRTAGVVTNDLSTRAVITSVAIAAGLGASSAHTWLKLPVVADMDRVMAATTLPTLFLGGEPGDDPARALASWAAALELPGARGLVVGRGVLYPPDDDVASAVASAAVLVHPAGAR
jgi:DhnA family fructose-bisphosphate aldolase class Ia